MPDFGLPDFKLGLPQLGLPSLGNPTSSIRAPLAPDERQSIGQGLLDRGKSGLSAVLNVLDWPGSKVRGFMAGKPGESVTGRQLLEHHGIVRPGDRSWGSWGLGLGADIATDPLTYMSFGANNALKPGARALQRAGHLEGWSRKSLLEGFHDVESNLVRTGHPADVIGHLRDQGRRIASPEAEAAYQAATGQALRGGDRLSGLARAHLPFAPDVGLTLGSGKLAQGVAGGLDRAGDWLKYKAPGAKALGGLFDWRRRRAVDEHGQRAMVATVPLRKQLESQGRLHEYDTISGLDKLIRANPGHEANISRAARISAEGTSPLAYLDIADPAELALRRGFLADTAGLGGDIAKFGNEQLEAGVRAGLVTRDAADEYALYVSRQSTEAYKAGTGAQFEHGTIMPTTAGHNVHREEVFRNLPGGTDRINDWASRFAGNPDKMAVANQIHQDMLADFAHVRGAPADPLKGMEFEFKAKELAKRFAGMEGNKYLGKINEFPYFSHDIASDVARRGSAHATTMSSAEAALKNLAAVAKPVGEFADPREFVSATRALKKLRLGNHDLGNELVGAGPELYRKLAPKGAGLLTPHVQGGAPFTLNKELKQWGIPLKDWEALYRSHANWLAPTETVAPLKLFDSVTNAFKALAYPMWPSSQVRNLATATLNNMRTGTKLKDYAAQYRLMRGLENPATADAIRRSQFGHARIFGEGGQNLELAGRSSGAAPASPREWSKFTPGTNAHGMSMAGPTGNAVGDTANLIFNEGIAQHGRDIRDRVLGRTKVNPFALSGVGGAEHDVLAPVVAGRKVSSNIENLARGAQYQGLIRQGYSPEMAARQIDKYHFNYGDLTPFERKVMKRAVPFYTFARKNLPLQMETLATRPAAFSTPFKPAMVNRDQQEYVPDYLSNGFAMPLGGAQDGTQRFLSSLGLPQEEAFREMSLWGGKPDLAGTAMRMAGNLNPIIKGPLEQIMDRQFYSGRKLSDLRPSNTATSLAGLLGSEDYASPISQFISNTPATRFATSLDKLLDTKGLSANGRKPGWATGLNLMTGARVTDVDVERQKYLEQRNALDKLLAGQPHVSTYQEHYVRPENRKLLTPDETTQLRMLVDMQQKAKEWTARQRQLHP